MQREFLRSALERGTKGNNGQRYVLTRMIVVSIMVIISKRRCEMELIQEYIPVTKVKSSLLELLRRINDSDGTIAITKNGVPEAVLLSMDRFQGILETLEILSDEKAMESIRRSIREGNKEMWVDFEEVLSE